MSKTPTPRQDIEKFDDILVEQGRRIRALHEIISRPDLSFDQQIDAALRLGCQFLGTEVGKVGRQDPANNISEFLNVVTMNDLPIRRGIELPLDKTFCQVTFSSPQSIAISHVSESEYKDHPAAAFLGMESYIGCSINVHGKKFGTVNFSNRTPVKKPFTEADVDLVNLIGSWISIMMERQIEAEELKKSKEAADRANQAKSIFLANMSHEIRTPLTSIIGYSEMALDDDQTSEEHIETLKIIRQSGDHLLNLINDILDFSKIEAGELEIEKSAINLNVLLSEIESIMKPQAHRKKIDFFITPVFPVPTQVYSDPLKLKQILLNLCSNATKFTNSGSVNILVNYDEPADRLSIAIHDTGIGISHEQLQHIFTPFRQADASISRRFGGTGLGLSLSRKLATLLDCTLEVTSKEGEGSEFALYMPHPMQGLIKPEIARSQDDIRASTRTYQDNRYATRLSGDVLIVDDNLNNQQLVQRYLQRVGVRPNLAENGAVAVDLALQFNYDLIFMDMQMPVMSGVDALKTLRKKNYLGPIVMLTGNVTPEDRASCLAAGCDEFLTKPIVREQLYQVAERFLKKTS